MTEIYLILGILFLILLLLFIFLKKKDKKEPDYNMFINIGIIFFIIGLINLPKIDSFLILGSISLLTGLYKKSKNKKTNQE